MTKLKTVNCEELMTEPLKPIEFVVDNLITQGLFILAGAPKIGKSWLALDICLSVAKGEPVLNANTAQGTALYLCLEDSRIRIQKSNGSMTVSKRGKLLTKLKTVNCEEIMTEPLNEGVCGDLCRVRQPSRVTPRQEDFERNMSRF